MMLVRGGLRLCGALAETWKGPFSVYTELLLTLSVPRAPLFLQSLQSYNSPGDWARELFKPSADSASLVVKIEKKFRFGFELFWGERHK